jgi:RES domain-containing protein
VKVYRLAHTDLAHEAITPSKAQGRWNAESHPVLYTSDHPALAALEVLNYWDDYVSMRGYYLYELEIPDLMDDAPLEVNHHDGQQTRAYGTNWIKRKSNLTLRVRSVCTPIGFNYVLNGKHPAYSQIKLTQQHAYEFDPRIQKLISEAKKLKRGNG